MGPRSVPAWASPGFVIRETRVVEGVTWARIEDAEADVPLEDQEPALAAPRWIVLTYDPITNARSRRRATNECAGTDRDRRTFR